MAAQTKHQDHAGLFPMAALDSRPLRVMQTLGDAQVPLAASCHPAGLTGGQRLEQTAAGR